MSSLAQGFVWIIPWLSEGGAHNLQHEARLNDVDFWQWQLWKLSFIVLLCNHLHSVALIPLGLPFVVGGLNFKHRHLTHMSMSLKLT